MFSNEKKFVLISTYFEDSSKKTEAEGLVFRLDSPQQHRLSLQAWSMDVVVWG